MLRPALTILIAAAFLAPAAFSQTGTIPDGFVSLFNGRDLSGWKIPPGDNGHWKVVDGVIDYDARSEAEQKHLWSERQYKDFILKLEWRLKDTPFIYKNGRILLPDGNEKLDAQGKPVALSFPDADSGVLVRGMAQAQVNIWAWPAGSGELWSVRRNMTLPAEVRAAATPKLNADRNIGEWNSMEITMKGDRISVVLNGFRVIDNALFHGVPEKGAIGLQHHGEWKDGQWAGPPSLVQFRNIYIKEQ
jgi:hypothetical protein